MTASEEPSHLLYVIDFFPIAILLGGHQEILVMTSQKLLVL